MSTRKPSPRNRSLRPGAEDLETRQLLSGTVSGTDIDGDSWTLQLIGPGSITVTKQPGSDGTPSALNSPTEINAITVAGTSPTQSRLVGTITKGAGGNGQVFFQSLSELGGRGEKFGTGTGLLAIDMPNFWLGNTTAVTSTTTTLPAPPSITIPDGVVTLRFGGVDTTHDQPATPPSTATSDVSTVLLGLPLYGGTRVIINKSISSAATVTPSSGTPTTIQHAVEFDVSGRINLFQADEIDGNATTPPGQFSDKNPNATGFGGTWVVSSTANLPPFFTGFPALQVQGGVTGAIGDVRVGGNATNFSTLVFDGTNSGDAHLQNFSIGGETNNVLVIVPSGGQNFSFGHGMDTVDLLAHTINTIKANRGALNSNVYVDRTISNANFGGDVVNSTILTGTVQNFNTVIETVAGTIPATSSFSTSPPPAPAPTPQNAEIGGGMTVTVAGNVTDSVFTASVQPNTGSSVTAPDTGFGEAGQLVLPTGHIKAKVEGKINNANATPGSPNRAFYAKSVDLLNGPVTPPNVPTAPYSGPAQPVSQPGIPSLAANAHPRITPGTAKRPTTQTSRSVPAGPRAKKA